MYSETVMDHFANPRNVGEIDHPDGVGEVGNPVCGDIMKIFLQIENDRIVDAKFKTFGCGAAIASSSMATELIKGKTLEEAWAVSNKAVAEALEGLPPIKMHCSVLAEEGIHKAINDYREKHGLEPWVETGHHHGEEPASEPNTQVPGSDTKKSEMNRGPIKGYETRSVSYQE